MSVECLLHNIGGQQQRVAIARALAKRPGLLLCDEPTGALDHEISGVILDLLRKVNKETGTTLVMITHNPENAHVTDRTAVIANGRISSLEMPKVHFRHF